MGGTDSQKLGWGDEAAVKWSRNEILFATLLSFVVFLGILLAVWTVRWRHAAKVKVEALRLQSGKDQDSVCDDETEMEVGLRDRQQQSSHSVSSGGSGMKRDDRLGRNESQWSGSSAGTRRGPMASYESRVSDGYKAQAIQMMVSRSHSMGMGVADYH